MALLIGSCFQLEWLQGPGTWHLALLPQQQRQHCVSVLWILFFSAWSRIRLQKLVRGWFSALCLD